MPAIITEDIRLNNANQFLESIGETANIALYTFIGQPSTINVVAEPDTVENQFDIWDNMIALKRISDGDVSLVVPRYDWASGNIYTAYRSDSNVMVDSQFYVMNSSFEVFKCLANNSGNASTVQPQASLPATNGNTALLADGYRWKYLYTISAPDATKFLTPSFMPVRVDNTVRSQAVDGGILHIEVENGGSGYATAPTITIVGDGTSATATAVLTGNSVSSVTVTNPGFGYRFANVSVSTGNAVLKPVIGPSGGHGENPPSELYGKYVMVNSRFGPTDTVVPIPLQFQQIGIVQDPKVFGTSDRMFKQTARAYKIITLDSSATGLSQGDVITGTSSGANAYVLQGNGSNVFYVQTKDVSSNLRSCFTSFTLSDTLTGIGSVVAVIPPEVQPDSGKVIYVDNRNPISRSAEQVESIHIVLEF